VALPWAWDDEQPTDAPKLPPLTLKQEMQLDLATQSLSARPHLLTFQRKALRDAGFLALAQLEHVKTGRRACIAGLTISTQRPPTAKGMGFIVLEDETGRVQVALHPSLAESLRSAGHVTLLATRLQPYTGVNMEDTARKRQQDDAPSRARDIQPLVNTSFGHQGDYRVARP